MTSQSQRKNEVCLNRWIWERLEKLLVEAVGLKVLRGRCGKIKGWPDGRGAQKVWADRLTSILLLKEEEKRGERLVKEDGRQIDGMDALLPSFSPNISPSIPGAFAFNWFVYTVLNLYLYFFFLLCWIAFILPFKLYSTTHYSAH